MDSIARNVLPLLFRGMGLRSDALSGVLDDGKSPSASSCELHVARYRGPDDGEPKLPCCSSAFLTPYTTYTRRDHRQDSCRHAEVVPPLTCCTLLVQQLSILQQSPRPAHDGTIVCEARCRWHRLAMLLVMQA